MAKTDYRQCKYHQIELQRARARLPAVYVSPLRVAPFIVIMNRLKDEMGVIKAFEFVGVSGTVWYKVINSNILTLATARKIVAANKRRKEAGSD